MLNSFFYKYSLFNISCLWLYSSTNDLDAQYLYASLFSFIKHRLGYMTLASYKDDLVGTSISKCPDGHMNDFSIYNTCIVEYEGEEKACNVTGVEYSLEEFPEKRYNPWRIFLHRFLNIIDSEEISPEIKSHFKLSALIVSRGRKRGKSSRGK